ncbi:MAG: hypothetical protein KDD70_04220 [Bdellovibrionales bacterium]|nr:hypothetical protein [Bdellovibrionales bacterium]
MNSLADAQRRCLMRALRALAKVFLKGDGRFREFIEMARWAFIDVAKEELAGDGEKVNVSRISVRTGIDRESTKRVLRSEEDGVMSTKPSLASLVIGRWEQHKSFTTKSGKPRVLSYLGADSEFHDLVRYFDSSINPGTVLFELVRVGAVEKTSRGVKLVGPVHHYLSNAEGILDLLGRNVESLVLAGDENATGGSKTRHHHMRTEFDNIFVDRIDRVRPWLVEEGRKFHKRLRSFLAKHDADVNPARKSEAGYNVSVGSFSFIQDLESRSASLDTTLKDAEND